MHLGFQPGPAYAGVVFAQVGATTTPGGRGSVSETVVTVGLLIGALMAITVAWLVLRRKLLDTGNPTQIQATALEQLRQLRAQGEISQEQYDAARHKMAAGLKSTRPTGVARGASGNRDVPSIGSSSVRPVRPVRGGGGAGGMGGGGSGIVGGGKPNGA